MTSIKGTETEKNLLMAFAGESQARNRYTYFASQAKKDGYEQISGIFLETAEQEKEHAKRFFKFLEGGEVEIKTAYPAGKIDGTLENLKAAAAGEKMEWGTLYPTFAETAEKEGFADVAVAFRMIATAEQGHEQRYVDLAENLKNDKVFSKDEPVRWQCRNCGFTHDGPDAPVKCPACLHARAYFELKKRNW